MLEVVVAVIPFRDEDSLMRALEGVKAIGNVWRAY
jgi:hypothetical protein